MKATTRKATMKKLVAGLCLAVLAAGPAMALDMTPFQIGFGGANAQLFPPETMVMGLRLNLVASENQDMMGLDLGIWSKSVKMDALQVNLVNLVEADFDGINVGLFNQMGSVSGLQAGLFNHVRYDINGVQAGVESYSVKMTERLAGYQRSHDIDQGANAVVEYEKYTKDPVAGAAILHRIAAYNEDDVRATLALRDWLVGQRDVDLDWREAVIE